MMSHSRHADPITAYWRLAGASALAAFVIALAGYWPIQAQFGESVAAALLGGLAVTLVGSCCGSIPVVATMNRPPALFASGALGGLAVRFVVTLGGGLLLAYSGVFAHDALLVSVAATQLLILAVDVYMIVRLSRRVLGAVE